MLRSNKASFGAIALALGSLTILCAADGPTRSVAASAKAAKKAVKALDHRESGVAIVAAEQAVALAPREAAYRLLLGQSYLQAGRFQSAEQAFADTLALDRTNGRAALNLALTQIARGDHQAARGTLDSHAGDIPAADRGLALALTGDTPGAVTVLTIIARSPETSAKVRQNLALAYALGGEWNIARVIAAADMSPADVDARLAQWAAFVQPRTASDQVASLLGVRPVADGGQPVALALTPPPAAVPTAVAVAAPAPVVAAGTVSIPVPPATPLVVPAAIAPVAPVAVAAVPAKPTIVFAAPREVVQAITPAMLARQPKPARAPVKVAFRPAPPARGNWYVQLGAFDSPEVARNGWVRARQRYAALKAYVPRRADVRTANSTLHLLSVGGFTRPAATDVCAAYRAHGGSCFIRSYAGDQLKAWLGPEAKQVAMK